MSSKPNGDNPNEAAWRGVLLGTDPGYRRSRRLFQRVPGAPRCKMCAVPFGGLAGPFMRAIGRGQWEKNPNYCGICFNILQNVHGGAEIECTLLFADVRGSTQLAEHMTPSEFHALMTRFYTAAAKGLVEHDGIVDKFVGDEVVAIFIPALTGEEHAQRAIEAARFLLRATGNTPGTSAWLPLGAGIHSGTAYVGAVGEGQHTEFSALGDVVNVAARLAAAASAGEILVSRGAVQAAAMETPDLERRTLQLRGKSTPTDVVVLLA